MAYVQQARSTSDAATYHRARTALRKSLALRPAGNFTAETGMGALESARHHFAEALTWARRATAANPYSAPAQGVLADAFTQLGRYEDSYAAVQRMTDLRPDSSALARASYTWELRGNTARARDLMNKSLQAAGTPTEKAFALTHLATLALETGDPRTALDLAGTGLEALPGDAALLEARARAHTALGQPRQAVADFTAAVAGAPLPQYLLGLGDLQPRRRRPEPLAAERSGTVLAPARAGNHSHLPHPDRADGPRRTGTSRTGLIGMGIAGGLVPSPSALVVLLGAVALGRTAFGVLLVVGYGLGMAVTLTLAGLLLVRLRDRFEARADKYARLRAPFARLAGIGPAASAALVLAVGALLTLRAAAGPW
ncbi:urease accessory protein UreH domain-containing protein [Streptomyces brevispora]|uniref:urease accessory protein UreH domain-containing protein n=1 Tax=Streptomyces brevispora TaxID=887462 RepID=UPI0035E16187